MNEHYQLLFDAFTKWNNAVNNHLINGRPRTTADDIIVRKALADYHEALAAYRGA